MDRIDKGEVYKWFALFEAWKQKPLVEVRIIGKAKTASGYFTDPDTLLGSIEKYDRNNIFFTINSVANECAGRLQFNKIIERPDNTTTDSEIVTREWVFLDVDVDRIKGVNATEEETHYAKAVARQVVHYLGEQGFNPPVVVFSGNGVHLYYRCNLQNTPENTKVIENFIKALGILFDTEQVKIDPVVYNAARVAKLPGTTSGKGSADDTERPQRMCRFLTIPSEIIPNDIAFFEKVASIIPPPPTPSRENDWGRQKFDLQDFLKRHNIEVKQQVRAAGGTRYILDHCVFNPNHRAKDAMIFQYDDGAIVYKCLHASCAQYKWRDVRLLYEPDAYSHKEQADFSYKRRLQGAERKPFAPQAETQEKGPIWLSLDEIPSLDPDSVESIATGIGELDRKIFGGTILQQLSVMTGRPGSGKSTLLNTILLSSVQQGYPTAIFSGELPNQLLKSWITLPAAGRNYVKPSVKRSDSYFVPKEVEAKILAWLKGKLFVHNSEYGNNWGQLRQDILQIVDKGAKNIILDNLMTLYLEYESDRTQYIAQRDFINELHEMVRDKNIHIWLVAHPRKQTAFLRYDDIAGASDIGNLADNIFIVHRVNQDFENQAKAFFPKSKIADILLQEYSNVIEIAKNRVPGLYMGDLVGVYYEPESKRMKNDKAEMFQYGWDSTPVQLQLPEETATTPDTPWYSKEPDDDLEF